MSNLNNHIIKINDKVESIQKIKKGIKSGLASVLPFYNDEFDDVNVEKKGYDDPDRKVGKAAADLKKLYDTNNQIYVNGGKAWCTYGWFEDNILNT